MDNMNIESAQYAVGMDGNNLSITAVIDGVTMSVPLDPANRHYAAIMEMVDAGELTIAEADA
jgi:hypothetical protein